jgi:hypothetical protein
MAKTPTPWEAYTAGMLPEDAAKVTRAMADHDILVQRVTTLETLLAGMVSVHDGTTPEQERELKKLWLPKAKQYLMDAKRERYG